jgi:ferritin
VLPAELESALNKQINWEQAAAQEYLAMAAWFEHQNYQGFARFMRAQADEEREHAMRLFDYIFNRGGRVRIDAIPQPPADYDSPQAVFVAAQAREQSNTQSIHALYKLASDLHDYPTQTMLHWFIDEQVEEEQWCEEAVTLLERAAGNTSALLIIDRRYGQKAETHG